MHVGLVCEPPAHTQSFPFLQKSGVSTELQFGLGRLHIRLHAPGPPMYGGASRTGALLGATQQSQTMLRALLSAPLQMPCAPRAVLHGGGHPAHASAALSSCISSRVASKAGVLLVSPIYISGTFWGCLFPLPAVRLTCWAAGSAMEAQTLQRVQGGGEGGSWGPALLPSHPPPSRVPSPQPLQPHAPALHRLTAAAAAVPRALHGNARAPRQLRQGLRPPPGPSPEPTPPRTGLPTWVSQLPQVLQASPATLPTQPHWSWCQGSSPLLPRKQPGSCGTRLRGCPYAHTLTGAAV